MPRKTPKTSAAPSKIRYTWTIDKALSLAYASPGLVAPETIAGYIELGIDRGRLRFLFAALPKNAEITGLAGRLTHVGDYAVEFSVQVRIKNGSRPVPMRMVVARNDHERGETVTAEFKNLTWLATRLPKSTPALLTVGSVFQPDRHARTEQHRHLPAYLTKPLPETVRCAFGNGEQLGAGAGVPRLLTRDDTDYIRRRIIEWCLRAYEPQTRRALPPPDIDRGVLRLVLASRRAPELWIAGCPTLWDRIDAVTLLHRLIGFEWRHGKQVLPLLPSTPQQLLEAVTTALGAQPGRDLLARYAAALESGRHPEHRRFTRRTLLGLIGEPAS